MTPRRGHPFDVCKYQTGAQPEESLISVSPMNARHDLQ